MTRQLKSSEAYGGALAKFLKPRRRRQYPQTLRRRKRPLGALGLNGSTTPTPLPTVSGKPSRVPQWRLEYDQKLPLLMDHFGIDKKDPYCWKNLALCLAVAHVPGFQEKAHRKAGRKRTVSWEEETKLYARFCELQQAGHSDRNAASLMAKELKKAGRSEASGPSILRRMQRYVQRAKESAAALKSVLAAIGMTQNPAP